MQPADEYWTELRRIGLEAGLHSLGVAPATPMLRARAALEERRSEGLADGMQFTYRNPVRSTTPGAAVAGARSVVVGLMSYAAADEQHSESVRPATSPAGYRAAVARYAWLDHYGRLKAALAPVRARLRADGHRAVVFADDNSLVDRETAWLAGLGWFGKNANILASGAGSFFVIGSIVTTAELPVATPVDDGCGSCSRCLPACPTGAIVRPGVIDAARCLTWVLQKPGIIDRRYRAAIGNRIYGCDECQLSCPPSVRMLRRAPDPSNAPMVDLDMARMRDVDVVWMLSCTDAELLERCDPWYIHRRDPRWLRRNALVILGNIGDPRDPAVRMTIGRHLVGDDSMLRVHALWAAARLGLDDVVGEWRSSRTETDPDVLDELAHLPACRENL